MPETDAPDLLPLPPVEAPPETEQDELQRELVPVLSKEAAQALATAILSDYRDAISDRSEWESRLAEWEDQYHGTLPIKNYPWPGASNMNVPLTMLGVETLKPRLVESVLGADPPVLVDETEPGAEELMERVSLYLNWQARAELRLEELVPESAHLFLIPGTVIAKTFWKVERRRVKYVRSFPSDTPFQDIFSAIFGEQVVPENLEKQNGLEWEGEVPQRLGAPLPVRLKFKFLDKETQVLVDREEVRAERPWIELLPVEDFIAPVRGGTDVQAFPWCQHRLWLSEADLRQKVMLGILNADAVEELLQGLGPDGEAEQMDSAEVRIGQAQTEGVQLDGSSSVRGQQFEILEDYRSYDVDDDEHEEEIISYVCPARPDLVLGWDYLDNRFAHGRRPFTVGRYLRLPFQFHGLSFAQVVQQLQDEINTIHNQRVDYGTIQNLPMYFYRASMTHSPTQYRLRPGEGVPVDNPQQDILIPRWQGSPSFGQAEEALLYQYFERLTGLTDLALGRQPNRVGATRTATGVASLLSEAGLRFKTAMEAFQQFWIGVLEDVLALDQQYLPPGKEFRVTGHWPERIVLKDRQSIAGKYSLRLAATSETMNRSIMREDATIKLQTMLNPMLIQAGLIGLKGIHRGVRGFLRAYGEVDPDAWLEIPRNAVVRSPEEELAVWVSGGDVKPTMLENLGLHLQTHMQQARTPGIVAVLGPEGMRKLQAHIAETLQLAQMQALSQGMGGGNNGKPVGPQAQNALTGATEPQTGTMQPTQLPNEPQQAMPQQTPVMQPGMRY